MTWYIPIAVAALVALFTLTGCATAGGIAASVVGSSIMEEPTRVTIEILKERVTALEKWANEMHRYISETETKDEQ
jgi:hypothetical protein